MNNEEINKIIQAQIDDVLPLNNISQDYIERYIFLIAGVGSGITVLFPNQLLNFGSTSLAILVIISIIGFASTLMLSLLSHRYVSTSFIDHINKLNVLIDREDDDKISKFNTYIDEYTNTNKITTNLNTVILVILNLSIVSIVSFVISGIL